MLLLRAICLAAEETLTLPAFRIHPAVLAGLTMISDVPDYLMPAAIEEDTPPLFIAGDSMILFSPCTQSEQRGYGLQPVPFAAWTSARARGMWTKARSVAKWGCTIDDII